MAESEELALNPGVAQERDAETSASLSTSRRSLPFFARLSG